MDTLDINDVRYDRKILDLQRRYDEQYDINRGNQSSDWRIAKSDPQHPAGEDFR